MKSKIFSLLFLATTVACATIEPQSQSKLDNAKDHLMLSQERYELFCSSNKDLKGCGENEETRLKEEIDNALLSDSEALVFSLDKKISLVERYYKYLSSCQKLKKPVCQKEHMDKVKDLFSEIYSFNFFDLEDRRHILALDSLVSLGNIWINKSFLEQENEIVVEIRSH